ncbi:MAG: hypothetical protein U5K69_13065 [Balneolaceae bacterium]|nr:hypothetical protein [Balneolaceae bacterium]
MGELEFIDAKGFMQRIEPEGQQLAMIIDGDGTTLFAFPTHRMKLLKGAVDSDEATRDVRGVSPFPAG